LIEDLFALLLRPLRDGKERIWASGKRRIKAMPHRSKEALNLAGASGMTMVVAGAQAEFFEKT